MAKTNEFNDVPVPKPNIHIWTVDDLYKELAEARKKGLGKKKIMLSEDDEGNGYHLMFFGVTENVADVFSGGYLHLPYSVKRSELKDYVILG